MRLRRVAVNGWEKEEQEEGKREERIKNINNLLPNCHYSEQNSLTH
jgi:hypothetical protein